MSKKQAGCKSSSWRVWCLALEWGGGGERTRGFWAAVTGTQLALLVPTQLVLTMSYWIEINMLQHDKPTNLSCSLRPNTGYKRALLSKRHSPVYNFDQEVFWGRRKLTVKGENIAKPPFSTGLMPSHHFPQLAGHSSLPGATLEEELGCSLERPSSPDEHGGNTTWFEPSCLLHTALEVLLHKFASLFVP